MSEKSASVVVNAKTSLFQREMKKLDPEVRKRALAWGDSVQTGLLTGTVRGVQGGIGAIRKMGGAIKSIMAPIAGVVSVAGFTGLIMEAANAEERFANLSVTMRKANGDFEDAGQLQTLAQKSAKRWSQSSVELAGALEKVYGETGNSAFAKDSLDSIAMAAQATGKDVGLLAEIAGKARKQFKVTAKELPGVMAAMTDASVGPKGIKLENLVGQMDKVGATARLAGLKGASGFMTLVKIAKEATKEGEKTEGSLGELGKVFGSLDGAKGNKAGAKLGLKLDGLTGMEKLEKVLAKTGGKESELAKVFGSQGDFVRRAFGKKFEEVFKKTDGSKDDKTQAATEDLRRHIKKLSDGTDSAARVREAAEKKNKLLNSRIKRSKEILLDAFTDPNSMKAVATFSAQMPKAAKGLAELTAFVVQNPAKALGLAGGAYVAQGVIMAMLQPVGPAIAAGMAKVIVGASSMVGQGVSMAYGATSTAFSNLSSGAQLAGKRLGALSLVAASAYAVYDQASKLQKELGDEDPLDVLRTASVKSGLSDKQLRLSQGGSGSATKQVADSSIYGFVNRGGFGTTKRYLDTDKDGNETTNTTARADKGLVGRIMAMTQRATSGKAPEEKKTESDGRQLQALTQLNRTMARTLSVHVTNAKEISPGGAPGSPPAPGNAPR